jgi:prolyl oligopeptidase
VKFLHTDPQFFYTDPESLLAGYRNIAKQIDPTLPEFFGKLPRLTYGVRAIPSYAADSAPAAYYMSGSVATGRPGWFCANTSNLPGRPKWQMQVLTLHESVPGHHLQFSLAQEQENVPEFRKYDSYTAFAEGWALYCERLGGEMGFYKDPYSRFGQLTFDMWRACRLVIDTGIHSEGWSRQQAIDYLMANAGKDEHDSTVEVDRYIASPGQALAYKIGQLKFLAIRAEAEKELGPAFNLRAFHDALLCNGSLPLPILDAQMQAWIANTKASVPKPAPSS